VTWSTVPVVGIRSRFATLTSATNYHFLGLCPVALLLTVYAATNHWATVIPTIAWANGIAAALIIGAVAGLLPADETRPKPPPGPRV
jgi:hypothetical protein